MSLCAWSVSYSVHTAQTAALDSNTDMVTMQAVRCILQSVLILAFVGNLAISLPRAGTRNLMQVYEMLEEETNCTFLELVSLTDYGNWCGLGNNGKTPVDAMDACCKVCAE